MTSPDFKLSIITMNANNAFGLQLTMSIVLEQLNRNIEYIQIDEGSTDNSKEILATNAGKLANCASYFDSCHYSAKKVIHEATGEYLSFVVSKNNPSYVFAVGCPIRIIK